MSEERLRNVFLWVVAPVLINLWMSKMLDDLLDAIPELSNQNNIEFSTNSWTLLFVIACFIVPPIEEFVFRGVMWKVLEWVANSKYVICVIIAIAFIHAHDHPLQRLGLISFSFYLSWLRIRENRLWPCILAHISFNITGMLSG